MEFYFVKLNVNGTYLSLVDPTSKPRFMCFPDQDSADKCVKYVSNFRSKYGTWPCFDMSRGKRKLESPSVKYRTPEQVQRYMEIESYDYNIIDKMAGRTNVSFYCVLRFETEEYDGMESISMSGQEMDGNADPEKYVEWMNINLKIT